MVAENLQRKVACHPGTNPVGIEKLPSGELKLTYKGSGAEETIVVDQVMMATGRTPNTQHLGLEVCHRVCGLRSHATHAWVHRLLRRGNSPQTSSKPRT